MRNISKNRRAKQEAGVALVIAMVSLLLITGVALAMVMASGMESSLNGNYRSSSSSYYAALAGLEEGRGRLLPTNPNPVVVTNGLTNLLGFMPVGTVKYILNPNQAAGESQGTILTTYADNEYVSEFGVAPTATTSTGSLSATNSSNIPGPMYKWVRINPITERSLGNVDVNGDGNFDAATPLYYDSGTIPATLVVPPMVAGVPNPSSTANQVFEITALAVLPNGSEKLMQYLVAPQTYNMNFPSALTLGGTVGNFAGASSNPYHVNGADGSGSAPLVPGCTPNGAAKNAIGVTNGASAAVVTAGIPGNRTDHYSGAGASTPDVAAVGLNSTLSTPNSLNQLVQNIRNNADAVIPNPPNAPNVNNSGTTYNFGGPGWPAGMSANNPQTVYVDGSFDLGPNTGYGLLVVTGNFTYHGNSGWNGVILVIGDGTTTFLGNGGGNGEFDGAIFAATTRDAAGTQLANLGTVNFDISGGGGNGIYYNHCWVNTVQKPPTYKVLSFKEIPYTVN
ncbi:MAG: putative rane protein [Candidatus Acidoferrum typicum]|nr:putative rane protein [Candidatus Acidoferrum typicum]